MKRGVAYLLAAVLMMSMLPTAVMGDELPADDLSGEEAVIEEEASPEAGAETVDDMEAGAAAAAAEAPEGADSAEEDVLPGETSAAGFEWVEGEDGLPFPQVIEGTDEADKAAEDSLVEEEEPAPLNSAGDISAATVTGFKSVYRMECTNLDTSSSNADIRIEGVSMFKYKPSIKVTLGGKTLKADTDYTVKIPDGAYAPFMVQFRIDGKGSYTGTMTVIKPAYCAYTFAGSNRYKTNIAILNGLMGSGGDNSGPQDLSRIVVVTGEDFPDALAANAYAGLRRSPLILVKRAEVPKPTSDYIKKIASKVEEVVVIGGKMDGAVKDLKELLPSAQFKTIAGSNRYQTADKVTKQFLLEKYGIPLDDYSKKAPCPVFVATGQTPADALSASSWSYAMGVPVLLVQDGTFNKKSDTANVIKNFDWVMLLGSSKVVSDKVVPAGIEKQRIGGKNRWETSRLISDTFRQFLSGSSWDMVIYVASDDDLFADALAAGQFLTQGPGAICPVILVNEKHAEPYTAVKTSSDSYGLYAHMFSMFIGSAGKDSGPSGRKGTIYKAVTKNLDSRVAKIRLLP